MKKQANKGITLVALVITVIVLLILAGVAINALNNSDLIGKSEKATEEYKKKAATEIINLKITNIQISNYVEKQKMPTLQELADGLCEDEEMEYVLTTSKNVASLGKLDKIVVGTASSIFTKLKAYPYEFEINSSLQLASIDGIKVGTTNNNNSNNDNTVSITVEQFNNLANKVSALETQLVTLTQEMNILKQVDGMENIQVYKASNTNVFDDIELETGDYLCILSIYGYGAVASKPSQYIISFGNYVPNPKATCYQMVSGATTYTINLTPRTESNNKGILSISSSSTAYHQCILVKLDKGHT